MSAKSILRMAASIVALGSGQAWADDAAVTDIVIVGSRGEPRLTTETSAPVDVFSGEELAAGGHSDLAKALTFLSPSFNYPRASSGPSSAGARPAMLRGLGPDQVLVLVNGKRRHATSIINFNNTVGRGAVPVDYGTIPITAIKRIEILRDGAAAQYGSDAIAGVINVVLKDDVDGARLSVQYGQTERGDGQTTIVSGHAAHALGDGGFLNVSGEIRDRNDTNGAEIDPRFGRITSVLGDPATSDIQFAVNAETPVSEASDLVAYGFLTVSKRAAESTPLFRTPTVSPAFYPQGFLPRVNLDLLDIGGAAGIKGVLAGWDWDFSDTFGYSSGDYAVSNTVNTSLGLASPTSFDGGGTRYAQNLVNLTASRSFDLLAGANLAVGAEHRFETYEMLAGDEASYTLSGAQGFPGFNPPSPVDVDRSAVSAFVDGELSLVKGLDVGLAARFEDYSDFGDEITGKASVFWRPLDVLAVRATASTGIRAPSLQQQYFSTVTSQRLPSGQITNVGNFAVTDPVSRSLGASPLRPETSESVAAGVVLTPGFGFRLAVDAYRIDIKDRISLSENIQGPQVTAILQANGITNAAVARFFTNAADTTSEGWEATAHWDTSFGPGRRLELTLGYGSFDTDLERLQANPILPQIALLGSASIGILTDAQPRNKALAGATLTWDRLSLVADVTAFGSYRVPTAAGNQTLEGKTSIDISAAYRVTDAISVAAGVLNAADEYPTRQAGDTTGRPYSEADPLGFSGREFYARVSADF